MQDLLLFSASSPVVAIVAYLAMRWTVSAAGSPVGVALCVLFSAGTFLYAACVHLLPDVSDMKVFTPAKIAVLTGSAFVPCLIGAVGGHQH